MDLPRVRTQNNLSQSLRWKATEGNLKLMAGEDVDFVLSGSLLFYTHLLFCWA